MRRPQDLPSRARLVAGRRRLWILIVIAVLIIIVASLRSIAIFYTDYLWFGSVHLSSVWRHLLVVKLALFFGFAAIFFVALWVSLAVVDRVSSSQLTLGSEDELVRRYQQRIAPRALLVRSVVALVLALIVASSAIGQWSNYLLFVDGVHELPDPQLKSSIKAWVRDLRQNRRVITFVASKEGPSDVNQRAELGLFAQGVVNALQGAGAETYTLEAFRGKLHQGVFELSERLQEADAYFPDDVDPRSLFGRP